MHQAKRFAAFGLGEKGRKGLAKNWSSGKVSGRAVPCVLRRGSSSSVLFRVEQFAVSFAVIEETLIPGIQGRGRVNPHLVSSIDVDS